MEPPIASLETSTTVGGPHPFDRAQLLTQRDHLLAVLRTQSMFTSGEQPAVIEIQDPVTLAKQVAADPESYHIMETETIQQFFLEIFQAALDDPQNSLGQDRPKVLRELQNIAARTGKLPRQVKTLEISKRIYLDFGGEAMISTADLQGESVVVRDARPPPAQAWTSDEGAKILSRIRREIISHIQLRHRNVLAILGIASSDEYPLSIVTPLAVNGNALSYLKRSKSSHRTDVMLKIVHDTTLALEYLHGLLPPIIHGDVHAQNILIDAEGRALLCDFGLSRIKHDQTRTSTNIVEGGRDRYLAPELFLSLGSDDFRTTPESDCYAFGMTILELATLERPFAEYKHDRAIYNVVVGGLRPKRPPIAAFGMLDSQAVDLVWSLLGEMWCQEPAKRLSMSVVLRRVVELSTHHSSSTSSSPAAASQRTIAQSLPSPLSSLSPTQVSQIAVVTGSISPTQHSKHAPLSPLHGVRIPQDRYGEGWGSALLHALDALEKFGRLPLETQELLPIAQNYARKVYLASPSEAADQILDTKRQAHRDLYTTLYKLVLSFHANHFAPTDEVLVIIKQAHTLCSQTHRGSALESSYAELYYLQGETFYWAGRRQDAIQALLYSNQRSSAVYPLNDVQVLANRVRVHNTLLCIYKEQGKKTQALQQALSVVQLAEQITQKFGVALNKEPRIPTWLLPAALNNLAEAYCAMALFADAIVHARRGAELSREIYHSMPSSDSAALFGNAMKWYELSLSESGPHNQSSLDELCSPADWKGILAQLDKTQSGTLYAYVYNRVQALSTTP